MKIEATVKMTFEIYKKYDLFHRTKRRKMISPFFLMPIVFLLAIVSILLDPANTTSWFFMVMFLVLLFCFIFLRTYVPKKYYKSAEASLSAPVDYVFEETHFEVKSSSPERTASSNCNYETIYKVYETSDTFYIYFSTIQARVIPKADITAGTPAELRALLQSKLAPNKYKICYRA